MIIKVTERKFADIMTDHDFSYTGACALFQYLEEIEAGSDVPMELDAVGLRCEFSEYETYLEYAKNCLGFREEDEEGLEEFAKSYAEKHGDVVCEFDGGIIVHD